MIKVELLVDSENNVHIGEVETVLYTDDPDTRRDGMTVAQKEYESELKFAHKAGNLKDPQWNFLNKYLAQGLEGADEVGVYHPTTRQELISIMESLVAKASKAKQEVVDLNVIDTSKITEMDHLFTSRFNGAGLPLDASKWDVSNVTSMISIFSNCSVPVSVADWDVSNVRDMRYAFSYIWNQKFTADISKWNVSNVENMAGIFKDSHFKGDVSNWDVRKVEDLSNAFEGPRWDGFDGDLSKWRLDSCENIESIFLNNNAFEGNIDHWFDNNHSKKIYRANAFKNSKLGKKNPPIWYGKNISKLRTVVENTDNSLKNKIEERMQFSKEVENLLRS